jgi:hypothetical protein
MSALVPSRLLRWPWGKLSWGSVASALLVSAGCQSPAFLGTARTLPAGANDITLSINLTRVSLAESEVEGVPLPARGYTLPNAVPELLYAHGVTDDFELGARLAFGSGLFELHAKYRLLAAFDRTLHVALAPAVGYRALALVNGPVLTLPAIVTFDLNPHVSLSGGPVLSYASYTMPRGLDVADLDLHGTTVYAGAGVGVELRPAFGIHVMPSVELQRSLSRRGDVENLPDIDLLFVGVSLGWGSWK